MDESLRNTLATATVAPVLLLLAGSCSEDPPARADDGDWPVFLEAEADEPRFDATVLVTIDTLRTDHVSAYGYPRETTPFLDSLAERGVRFEDAKAAISHTAPSHSTMLTGVVPSVHGVRKNGQLLSPEALDIATVHREAGHESAAFLNASFLQGVAGRFDHVGVRSAGGEQAYTGEDVVDAALAWLEAPERTGRFFLWVHLYDPHEWKREAYLHQGDESLWSGETPAGFTDYVLDLHGLPPREGDADYPIDWGEDTELLAPLGPRGLETFLHCIDRYDELILFSDRQVQRLYEAIEARFPDAKSLWIVTSDHGEGLASHGVMGHGSHLYDEQLSVPLIFHASDDSLAPRVVAEPVAHIDLLATAAEALGRGVRGDARYYEGRSLWPLLKGERTRWDERFLFAQRRPFTEPDSPHPPTMYAIQTPARKLIVTEGLADQFFDLEADPKELRNLGADHPDVEALRKALEGRLFLYEGIDDRASTAEISAEWLEELNALGY